MTNKDLERYAYLVWFNHARNPEDSNYEEDIKEQESLKSKIEEQLEHDNCSMYYCVKNEELKEKAEKWDLYLEKGSASEAFLEEENRRLKEQLETVEKENI